METLEHSKELELERLTAWSFINNLRHLSKSNARTPARNATWRLSQTKSGWLISISNYEKQIQRGGACDPRATETVHFILKARKWTYSCERQKNSRIGRLTKWDEFWFSSEEVFDRDDHSKIALWCLPESQSSWWWFLHRKIWSIFGPRPSLNCTWWLWN